MMNYFYWYSIAASIISILYVLPLSKLNKPLDNQLLVLIIVSVIVSFVIGFIFRRKFEYYDLEYKYNKYESLPFYIILFSSFFEFIVLKDIPLISVTFLHVNKYKEFTGIPVFHVFICMIALYYCIEYIYKAISYSENRKRNIFFFVIINVLMLLYNMRSFLMISLFIMLNLVISKKIKKSQGVKPKNIAITVLFVLLLLYGFGCFGNLRDAKDIKNSDYIERVAMYYNWPDFIPKQYMWAYTYATSPLANFNYNIIQNTNNSNTNYIGFFSQFLPFTIATRLPGYDSIRMCRFIKEDINVCTGYCRPYVNSSYTGLMVFWIVIMFFPTLLFRYKEDSLKRKQYMMFICIYNACIVFMAIDNMFNFGGTSATLWMSTFLLINRYKFVFHK